jgi:hypothetical protein
MEIINLKTNYSTGFSINLNTDFIKYRKVRFGLKPSTACERRGRPLRLGIVIRALSFFHSNIYLFLNFWKWGFRKNLTSPKTAGEENRRKEGYGGGTGRNEFHSISEDRGTISIPFCCILGIISLRDLIVEGWG